MRVVIRTDASAAIGLGHVQRCVALAHALGQAGSGVEFVTRDLGVAAGARIRAAGFTAHELPAPAGWFAVQPPAHAGWAGVPWEQDARETAKAAGRPDWVVVDHYAFDERWHRAVKAACGARIVAIDDLADRPLASDLLIDHTYAEDHRRKYAGRVVEGTPILGGPRYALLGPAYAGAPRHECRAELGSIGIFMGGTDSGRRTLVALDGCRAAGFAGPIEVVATQGNPHLAELRRRVGADANATLTLDLPDLSAFFARHDLQVGAGGGATWERCCIGAPTLAMAVAQNQHAVLEPLLALGVLRACEPEAADIARNVRELMADPEGLRAMARRAGKLVDGRGAQRVAMRLAAATLRVRPAGTADSELMYRWRNDPATRAMSRDHDAIGHDEHERWLASALADPRRLLLVGEVGRTPVGVIRFDGREASEVEVSLYLDPALHGLGLGSALLRAGEGAARSWAGDNLRFTAMVLDGNAGSRRMFESAGYSFTGETGHKA